MSDWTLPWLNAPAKYDPRMPDADYPMTFRMFMAQASHSPAETLHPVGQYAEFPPSQCWGTSDYATLQALCDIMRPLRYEHAVNGDPDTFATAIQTGFPWTGDPEYQARRYAYTEFNRLYMFSLSEWVANQAWYSACYEETEEGQIYVGSWALSLKLARGRATSEFRDYGDWLSPGETILPPESYTYHNKPYAEEGAPPPAVYTLDPLWVVQFARYNYFASNVFGPFLLCTYPDPFAADGENPERAPGNNGYDLIDHVRYRWLGMINSGVTLDVHAVWQPYEVPAEPCPPDCPLDHDHIV